MAITALRNPTTWILSLLLLFLPTFVTAMPMRGAIAGINARKLTGSAVISSDDEDSGSIVISKENELQKFYYNQTLDHFNYRPESYTTFPQKYYVSFKFWKGASAAAPIFVYLGAEEGIESSLGRIAILSDNPAQFGALQVYIEHRYYGESVPFGSMEEAMKNASTRGYFNSAQALADYAEIIDYLKKNLTAEASPVIVVGGSYGGYLAAWFRLKYPHLALGALASSAPIRYFDDVTSEDGVHTVTSKDFREASQSCYNTIKESWSEIDRVAAQANGLSILSQKFKACIPFKDAEELKGFLRHAYVTTAQYNNPPVEDMCKGVDAGLEGTDLLGRVFSGLVSVLGNEKCYKYGEDESGRTSDGWIWQRCSEIVVFGSSNNNTMFPPDPNDFQSSIEECRRKFGVYPRPNWITTYYGGHHMKLYLKKFGSNIIFSNGLRDPLSSAGILENISDSIVALNTVNGSHCLDLLDAQEGDPEWLVEQRKKEVEIIQSWIQQYYADLHEGH